MYLPQLNLKPLRRLGIGLALLLAVLLPFTVQAAQLTSRKLTLGSSAPGAVTTYTFDFTTATTATFQSYQAQICTTASGSCTTPTGLVTTSSTLNSTNLSGTWSVNNGTAGSLRASATGASSTTAPAARQIVFGSVTNPTTTNQTFFARMTLYSDTAWTTPVDTGTVAASTATQITLTGSMDESLVFCTGTSITGTDCGTVAGSSIDFGAFSSTATRFNTSVMAASTNGQSGYAITINGATLTSGGNTITALSTPTASTTGTEQFGVNLKDNSTPDVGAEVSPSPNGTTLKGQASTDYNTANLYKFVTGNQVAASDNGGAGATNAQTFTVSYIVNVAGNTEAGTYTATMTYICTATF